jgi:Skp family chaperone for outer membrane proteins
MRCLGKIVLGGVIGCLGVVAVGGTLLALGKISPTTLAEWLPKKREALAPGDFIPLAVVNMTRVKAEAAAFKTLKIFIEEQNKALHEEILTKENLLRSENDTIKKQEAAQKKTTQELIEKKQAFNKKHAEVEQLVLQKKSKLDQEVAKGFALIDEKFDKIIAEAAVRYHARVVIDRAAILYAEGVDLTDVIIQDLNQQMAGFAMPLQGP